MEDIFFTEEHQLFRQSFRAFLEKEVRPNVDEWEMAGKVPRSLFRKFGEMGYFGLAIPESEGGLGLDTFYGVVYIEEMARMNSGGTGAALGAHSGLALTHLNAEGNAAQKEKYLQPGLNGEIVGCLAITEPGGGSDVASIRTKAERKGDYFIINGSKTFITNAYYGDFIIAVVRTDPNSKGAKGLSLLIVDRNMEGVSVTELNKLGWRASDTGEIAFQDVKVPAENLLGEAGRGFYYVMQHFITERLAMALEGVSGSRYALEVTLQYMSERSTFGKKINQHQVLRHRIAQMSAEIESIRAFVYHLYRRHGEGEYLVKEAAMAKLLGTQLHEKVITQCLQMFGGYGFMEDYPLARMFRDSRLGTIGGGTNEILCEIISKMMIDTKSYQKSIG
jgi:alkylation response protein AidB-like acyl-CoA dehydrogenase